MNVTMQGEEHSKGRLAPVAVCLLLSLLIHGGLVCTMPLALLSITPAPPAPQPPKQRVVQIIPPAPEPPQEVKTDPDRMVKTDPDQPEQEPEQADFRGKRSSSESAAANAPDRYDDAPLPTQNGEEDPNEIITFDQDRQEGDLAHEGAVASGSSASQTSSAISPEPPSASPTEANEDDENEPTAEGTASLAPIPPADEGNILIKSTQEEQEPTTPMKVDKAVQTTVSRPSAVNRTFYDPSLAPHMQPPGFRTRERHTRSTGRFVIGAKPSLNVSATARGRYEAEIYRRIAYYWYRACDDHMGDIIPGSIIISLRINTRGLLQNMQLVRRRGASVTQQSFTFGAIRRATLPPMPADVQQDIVGDLLEIIFQFNFD